MTGRLPEMGAFQGGWKWFLFQTSCTEKLMKSKSGIWLFYKPAAFREFRTAQALISQAVHISEHWRSAGHCHHQDNKARRTCHETNTGPSVHDKQKVQIHFLAATDERKWTVNKHRGTKLMRGKSDSQRERERNILFPWLCRYESVCHCLAAAPCV